MIIGKVKIKPLQVARVALQIFFLIILPTLYYNALNGTRILFVAAIHQKFSAVHASQLIEAIAIIPITLLLGRFFCGWLCAFGAFFDWIYLISHKAFKTKFRMNEKADAVLKYFKYLWLVLIIVILWVLGSNALSTASPWDAFGMLVAFGKFPDIAYVATNLTVGFVLLILIGIGSVFIERFFCRYFCPLGAVFAIISKLKITAIKKPFEKCGKCRICTNNCAMGIPLYKSSLVRSGECINCMKCIEACPRKNVTFTAGGSELRPLVAGTVTAAAITGVYYLGNLTANVVQSTATATSTVAAGSTDTSAAFSAAGKTSSAKTSSKAAETPSKATASSKTAAESSSASPNVSVSKTYNDGTYQGSGTGFRGGTTTVSVTIRNDQITAVNVISTDDDQQFFDAAYSTVADEIISTQSAQVDAVSGATYSSNGIMTAVADALFKAKA